jgi:serine/threonine protein kinase
MGETADKADLYISFLQNMLKMDPNKRATAQDLLAHPWLVENNLVQSDLEERK